ncbi:MAG: diaminopimelate decarboxylase [Gaiellales bacterium]|nr:diaminopimelate decarboxylase [Gaiellales bacterium]
MSEIVRSGCEGIVPLPARLEPWQVALCAQPAVLAGLLERHGSPLNVIAPAPLARNVAELQQAADNAGVDMRIFFARKANKALALVDEARRHGLGIDVASERELRQVLERGVPPADVVVTAAVKPRALLAACVAAGVTVAIDNEDELELLAGLAARSPRNLPIALRLAPVRGEGRPATRFGLAPLELLAMVARHWPATASPRLTITGVHFHLDGYDATDRVTALTESIGLVEVLRERGHKPAFIDIGGGIPMSYLDDEAPWRQFWSEHCDALLGRRQPLTFEGHGLGLTAHAGKIIGRPNSYPYFQAPTRGDWLAQVLATEVSTRTGRQTAAEALRAGGLQLHCEPGRSLADGCGLTAARVEFRKQRRDGTWLIGVAMNRTQCRSTSDDFLVDPLLVRAAQTAPPGRAAGPLEGYLVGAYCVERELLTWRRLRFPHGVAVGDMVVFPNTAGYLMHILESASHQIPLARNLVTPEQGEPYVDAIDEQAADAPDPASSGDDVGTAVRVAQPQP